MSKEISDAQVFEALETIRDYCTGHCVTCALSVGANPYRCMVSAKDDTVPKYWVIKPPSHYKAFE